MSSWPKLGFRREASILLPAALLGLIALSTFTLFSYRASISRLVDDERSRAASTAAAIASRLGRSMPDEATLSRMLLGADSVAIIDEMGLPIVEVGIGSAPAPLALPNVREPVGIGPLSATGTIVGLSPMATTPSEPTFVRVDYRAPVLLGQSRALPLLVALVLSVNAGLLVLVILYLRHLLRPLDALLDRAKSLQGTEPSDKDDVEMLLETFERAVTALERPVDGDDPPAFEADIAALQRTLATGLESGLLVLDARGEVLSINPAGRELLEIEREVDPGTNLEELLPADDPLRQTLEEAVASGSGIQRRECDLTGASERTVGLTVHPLHREDGAVRGWLGLFADLTEIRKRNEEERLSESLEQIGALTAGLAHELRNGLASLRGYLTLIERSATVEAQALQEDLVELRHEADHLQRVVEDFLSFARPGSVRVEPVVLERLVHRAASDPVLAKVPIAVRSKIGTAEVSGDPQLLERALRNLLHNAARAQREGAHADEPIRVRIVAVDEGFDVLIEDRGPGIADAVRDRLFHPFASGSAQGVGLGLALSRRIAELHGGTVQLRNRDEGGALARLHLPHDRFVTNRDTSLSDAAQQSSA
ncbi:MAG: ATP-binding protein [Acidobacteriota bacterium]